MSDINSTKYYERIRDIGEGGFGKAVLVRRKRDAALFVVKEVKLEMLAGGPHHKTLQTAEQEAKKESEIATGIIHNNIVRVYASFVENRIFYMVMEYCEKGDLEQVIGKQRESGNVFKESRLRNWMKILVYALQFLHDKLIIHRDIKPGNIFVYGDDSETLKLGDFGIAKVLGFASQKALTVAGTPLYLAPEMCQGKTYDTKVDVWMLGVVLYELASFKLPFTADMPALILQIIMEEPKSINDGTYSSALYDLLGKMLMKDPAKRPSMKQITDHDFLTVVTTTQAIDSAGSGGSPRKQQDERRPATQYSAAHHQASGPQAARRNRNKEALKVV